MNENEQLRDFAEALWENYLKQKVQASRTTGLTFFRAQVTTAASAGTVTVQRPFDTALSLPYVPSAESYLTAGSEALVLVLGDLTNAIVLGPPSLQNL